MENLTKNFGSTVAVEDVTFEVKDKEFVCLLGPSGSGKSTILNCIAGIETPDSGNVYFDDRIVNDVRLDKRNVGMVFQNLALYPHMTVYDNLAFSLKIRRISPIEIKERVLEVAEKLKITHALDRKPGTLSGGEMQRVAIGRAIIRSPTVYLLDEPLTALDALLRVEMRAELKKIHRDLGQTFIYVTHDQIDALVMADRVAVLNHGRLLQYDTPETVYNHPTNKFVANFIGSPSINLIEGSVSKGTEGMVIDLGFVKIDGVPFQVALESLKSSEIILGVRPENVILTDPDRPLPGRWVEGMVYLTEPLGAQTNVTISVNGTLIRALISSDQPVRVGERKHIGFQMSKVRIFDKETESAVT